MHEHMHAGNGLQRFDGTYTPLWSVGYSPETKRHFPSSSCPILVLRHETANYRSNCSPPHRKTVPFVSTRYPRSNILQMPCVESISPFVLGLGLHTSCPTDQSLPWQI